MSFRICRLLTLLSTASVAAAGCSVVSSENIDQIAERAGQRAGVMYALPRALIPATLFVDSKTGDFSVDLGDPEYVPDPEQRYFFRYQPHPSYEDAVKITLAPGGMFVKKIDVTSEDKTGAIPVEIAKELRSPFEAGETPADAERTRLTSFKFDPTDKTMVRAAVEQLNEAIHNYFRLGLQECEAIAAISKYNTTIDDLPLDLDPPTKPIKFPLASPVGDIGTRLKALEEALTKNTNELKGSLKGEQEALTRLKVHTTQAYQRCLHIEICGDPVKPLNTKVCTALKDIAAKTAECPETTDKQPQSARLKGLLEVIDIRLAQLQARNTELAVSNTKLSDEKKKHQTYRNRCEKFKAAVEKAPAEVIIDVHDYRDAEHTESSSILARTKQDERSAARDCRIGVCYRVKEPYRIDVRVEQNGIVQGTTTRIVELPNKSPLLAIDIRRAFLVKKVVQIDFDDKGFLSQVYIDKPSELVAFSKLPLDILDAIAAGFEFQAKVVQKKRDVAKQELALLKARVALDRTRGAALESAKLPSGPSRKAFGPSTFSDRRWDLGEGR